MKSVKPGLNKNKTISVKHQKRDKNCNNLKNQSNITMGENEILNKKTKMVRQQRETNYSIMKKNSTVNYTRTVRLTKQKRKKGNSQ